MEGHVRERRIKRLARKAQRNEALGRTGFDGTLRAIWILGKHRCGLNWIQLVQDEVNLQDFINKIKEI